MWFEKKLKIELQKWQDDQLIDPVTAQAIARRYEEPSLFSARFLLYAVAALFVSLALLLLVAHNWQDIPRWLRLIGIMLLCAVVHGVGIRQSSLHENVANILFFIGNFCFLAAVALIAQMYQIGGSWQRLMITFALFSLPFAWLRLSLLLILQVLVALMIALFGDDSPRYLIFLVLPLIWIVKQKPSRLLFFGLSVFVLLYGAMLLKDSDVAVLSWCALWLLGVYRLPDWFAESYRPQTEWMQKFALWGALPVLWITDASHLTVDFSSGWVLIAVALLQTAFSLWHRYFYHALLCLLVIIFIMWAKILPVEIMTSVLWVLLGLYGLKYQQIVFALTSFFMVALVRYFSLVGDYVGTAVLFGVFALMLIFVAQRKSV